MTIWIADSFADAIALAEREAAEYQATLVNDGEVLALWQAFEIAQPVESEDDSDINPVQRLSGSGVEVFSLIRDSDLPPKEYLDQFFDTGTEHQGKTG